MSEVLYHLSYAAIRPWPVTRKTRAGLAREDLHPLPLAYQASALTRCATSQRMRQESNPARP
jgi:hypothetical protein